MAHQPMRAKSKPMISHLEPIPNQEVRGIINFPGCENPLLRQVLNTSQNRSSPPLLPSSPPFVTYIQEKSQGLGFWRSSPAPPLPGPSIRAPAHYSSRVNSNCIWLKDGNIPHGHWAIYLWKRFNEEFQSSQCPTKKAHLWISMFSPLPWEHLRGGGGTSALQPLPSVSHVSFSRYKYSQAAKGIRTGCF